MLNISVLLKDIDSPMGKYLICQTAPDGLWSLPCGCARTNETPADAVRRIMWEQLRLDVIPGKMQLHARRRIVDQFVVCEYYDAIDKWRSEPTSDAYAAFAWVRPENLGEYEFEDVDARFMSRFIPWISSDGSEIPYTKMF